MHREADNRSDVKLDLETGVAEKCRAQSGNASANGFVEAIQMSCDRIERIRNAGVGDESRGRRGNPAA